MPEGIPNRGNTCYAASILQCFRRIFDTNLNIEWQQLSGNMEDPHEFYCFIVDRIPTIYKQKLLVKFSDGVEQPYISVTPDMKNNHGPIIQTSDIICLYRIPTQIDANSCNTLTVCGKTYNLVAMICHIPGHYYSIVEENKIWYRCNDNSIIEENNSHHCLYMCFYQINK